eukprot:jgi/Galph1/5654/GphlegSOOS_G4273.1
MEPTAFTIRDLDKELPVTSSLRNNMGTRSRSNSDLSMGWLLRLFRSDFFDAWMAVTYLYRYRGSRGVQDYLCNELYKLSDEDLELYLPQLNLLVHHTQDSIALEKFVMDKCSQSMHFALQVSRLGFSAHVVELVLLKVYWFLQAACEDCHGEKLKKVQLLRTHCETAAVNGCYQSSKTAISHLSSQSSKDLLESLSAEDTPSPITRSRSNSAPQTAQWVHGGSSYIHTLSQEERSRSLNCSPRGLRKHEGFHTLESFQQNSTPDRKYMHASKPPRMPATGHGSPHPYTQVTQEEATCTEPVGKTEETKEALFDEQLLYYQTRQVLNDVLSAVEEDIKQNVEDTSENILSSEYMQSALDSVDALSLCRRRTSAYLDERLFSLDDSELPSGFENETNKGKDTMLKSDSETEIRVLYPSSDHEKEARDTFIPGVHKTMLTSKQERFDYFHDGLIFVKQLVRLSAAARDTPPDKRYSFIQRGFNRINDLFLRRMAGLESHPSPLKPPPPLPSVETVAKMGRTAALRSLHLPIARAVSRVLRILRLVPEETVVFPTRSRVPFLVFVEIIETKMLCSSPYIFLEHMLVDDYEEEEDDDNNIVAVMDNSISPSHSLVQSNLVVHSRHVEQKEEHSTTKTNTEEKHEKLKTPTSRQREIVQGAVYGSAESAVNMDQYIEQGKDDPDDPAATIARDAALLAVYGEMWHWKAERIRKASPFGHFPGWKLASFIVKAGDDLRQEQLALQLISQFRNIFREENLSLWVRPFTVVCLSSDSGLVETLPDAVSLHALKKRTPNFTTLLDYFERIYGPADCKRFRRAQRNFVESMAGYSLVCYLLQIKDRHNGNIMLGSEGRVIHIDFGFMLGNSPGSIRFESAPFKLTSEFIQVMGGTNSEPFQYFRELVVQGFLAARKHHEKLTTLVEIMIEGTKIPCMHGGHSVLESFRQRFSLGLLERECIHHMLSLIEESVDNWRTRQYDRYQFYTNGIL